MISLCFARVAFCCLTSASCPMDRWELRALWHTKTIKERAVISADRKKSSDHGQYS